MVDSVFACYICLATESSTQAGAAFRLGEVVSVWQEAEGCATENVHMPGLCGTPL